MANVLIRTDASTEIGIGHAMRCLALAEELAFRGHQVVFVSTSLPEIIQNQINALRLHHVVMPAGAALSQEYPHLSEVLSSLTHPVIAITDGYHFDEQYQSWLKDRVELLVCIDDLATGKFNCHGVLNQNLGFREDAYVNLVRPGTAVFAGPKFALLLSQYRSRAGSYQVRPKASRILISMGGGDRPDMTFKALAELVSLENTQFDVILGPAYPHENPAARLGSKARNVSIHTNVLDLAVHIEEADVAICPSGSTVWQICCIGAPLITFSVVENQASVARGLAAERAAVVIERDWTKGELLHVATALLGDVENRTHLSVRAKRLVDGQGVVRVGDWIASQISR